MFYFPLFNKHNNSSNIIRDVLCHICITLFLCDCPNLSVILLFLFFALFSYVGLFSGRAFSRGPFLGGEVISVFQRIYVGLWNSPPGIYTQHCGELHPCPFISFRN